MSVRIPSLNWLRVFEAAARHQSFARAAEALHMSAPAVSQQIRALEGYLGRPLFERGPHSVALTEAGRQFLPTVSQALGALEISAAGVFGDPRDARLTVQSVLVFGTGWLVPRLGGFRMAHPRISLMLTTAVYLEDFRRPGAELRITFGLPPAPGEDGVELFGETLVPVARADIAAGVGCAGDLTRLPLIEITTHRANWSQLLSGASVGTPDRLSLTYTDNTVTALGLAAAGLGVALARSPATDGLVAALGLVPCPAGVSLPGVERYHLIHGPLSALSPAARAFRDWLLEEAAV